MPLEKRSVLTKRMIGLMALLIAGCGQSGTKEFASEAGNYRVGFPGIPTSREENTASLAGPMKVHMDMVDHQREAFYSVAFLDYPPASVTAAPEELLNTGLDTMVRSAGWRVEVRSNIALDSHPGREIVFKSPFPGGKEMIKGWARVYLVGQRLYQVIAGGPESKMSEQKARAFLDSFALLKPVVATAATPPPAAVASDNRPAPAPVAPAPSNPQPQPQPQPPAAAAELKSSEGGATILAFRWVDEDGDESGSNGREIAPDGVKDQHFVVELDLPPGAIVEEIGVAGIHPSEWLTRPSSHWPLAVIQDGKALNTSQVERLGSFAGKLTFDLFANTYGTPAPGTPYALTTVVTVDGTRYTLGSKCLRP